MLINIVTLFPEMFSAITDCGVTSRAVSEGLINLRFLILESLQRQTSNS